MEYIYVIGGLILLAYAGDKLVEGAVGLAEKLNISKLIIGLTVVAFGTSAPELVVGVNSALKGSPSLALGNVVGSNTANILLVMGAPALFFPFSCYGNEIKHNYLIMLGVSVLFYALTLIGIITLWSGLLLILMLYVFLHYSIKRAQKNKATLKQEQSLAEHAYEDTTTLPDTPKHLLASIFSLIFGIVGLLYGANILVDGAITIARDFNVSEAVIGLTIVAIGTSLPELVTAIAASRHDHGDVIAGNIIGSNLFNILAITGATAITAPIPVEQQFKWIDIPIMLLATLLLWPFVSKNIRFKRSYGLIFILLYATYLAILGIQT